MTDRARGTPDRAVFAALAWALVLVATGCRCAKAPPAADLVFVPAARFEMGCAAADSSCAGTERPQQVREVASFRLDRVEVTQRAFAACVKAGGCVAPPRDYEPERQPEHPVVQVTWGQARGYCRWRGGRLPTEAEWELAARGTDGRRYPWGNEAPTCERAHLSDCGDGPRAVGTLPAGASPFGVLDLAGNVDEWVEDSYAPYGRPEDASSERVARGGAYDAWHSRTTARSALNPEHRDALLGFRCAADVVAR